MVYKLKTSLEVFATVSSESIETDDVTKEFRQLPALSQ
jgi:hypothetical protein